MRVKGLRYWAAVAVLALTAVGLEGCKDKLNQDQMAAVSGAALYANERAASWLLNSDAISSKEEKWAAAVDLFKAKHGQGLSSQAVAFAKATSDLVGGKLGKVAKQHLIESASTAAARHEDFVLMRPYLKAKNEADEAKLQAYFDAHAAGLKDLSDRLAVLAGQLRASGEKSASKSPDPAESAAKSE